MSEVGFSKVAVMFFKMSWGFFFIIIFLLIPIGKSVAQGKDE